MIPMRGDALQPQAEGDAGELERQQHQRREDGARPEASRIDDGADGGSIIGAVR